MEPAAADSSTPPSSPSFTTKATAKPSSIAWIIEPNGTNVFHLNLFAARNWIQIPNAYDQLGQDQRQRVLTWNFAPGFQHTFNSRMLWTISPYIRKDQFTYYGSRDPFADQPSTQDQARQLLNWGVKSDLAISHRPPRSQDRRRSQADPPGGELRLRDHRLHVQSRLPGSGRRTPPGPRTWWIRPVAPERA